MPKYIALKIFIIIELILYDHYFMKTDLYAVDFTSENNRYLYPGLPTSFIFSGNVLNAHTSRIEQLPPEGDVSNFIFKVMLPNFL